MHINDVKGMLRQMATMDQSGLPTGRFKAFLRNALIASQGFTVASAETIAARMVVDLGQQPIEDDDLVDMANSYARVIANMADEYKKLGFQDPARVVEESAGQLTMKIS